MGDVGLIVSAILSAVFFTMLMLTGNTIAQATRERTPELAVMRVLGFHPATVLWIVLLESVLLTVGSAALGLLAAHLTLQQIDSLIPGLSQLGPIGLTPAIVSYGLAIAFGIGLLVGLPPSVKAMRLRIADALRV
jgi:putative ABC transport system permease protein